MNSANKSHSPNAALGAVVVACLTVTPVVSALMPSESPWHDVRSIVALVQVLLAPGYAATYLVPIQALRNPSPLERLALGVALSIAIVFFEGLILNVIANLYSEALLWSSGAVTVLLGVAAIAVIARRVHRWIDLDSGHRESPGGLALSATLVLPMVALVILVGLAVSSTRMTPSGATTLHVANIAAVDDSACRQPRSEDSASIVLPGLPSPSPSYAASGVISDTRDAYNVYLPFAAQSILARPYVPSASCLAINIGIANGAPLSNYEIAVETAINSTTVVAPVDATGAWQRTIITSASNSYLEVSMYDSPGASSTSSPLRTLRINLTPTTSPEDGY